MRCPRHLLAPLFLLLPVWFFIGIAEGLTAADAGLFARTNLIAWCIVPFDAGKRTPEARAAMLEKLGFKHFAYDYRAEHIPSFDAEVEACQRHGVSLDAWWFPTQLNDEGRLILGVIERHRIHPQLWVMGGGAPVSGPVEQKARVEAEASRIFAIATEAERLGCTVGLYNHGQWFGEPENQIEIIEVLRQRGVRNVGIIYNLHHGHGHLDRFPALLARMKPYLLVLNVNGMVRDGEAQGRKILPIGDGDLEAGLLTIIRDSGWHGRIGILNHTDDDAEARLARNLAGLDRLVKALPDRTTRGVPTP